MRFTEKTQESRQEKRVNTLVKAIRNISQLIIKEKNRENLMKAVCENLVATDSLKNSWIVLMNPSGKFECITESGIGTNFTLLRKLFEQNILPDCIKKVLAQNKALITSQISLDCCNCPSKSLCEETTSFCTKLEHDGRIYGILTASILQEFTFNKEEQALYHEVANIIAFGLYNIEREGQQSKLVDIKNQYYDSFKESKDRLRALFEYLPDAYYILDDEGRHIDCNLAAEKLSGYSKEELIGKNYKDLTIVPPKDFEMAAKFIENAKHFPFGPVEIIANCKDGKQIYTEIRTFPFKFKDRNVVLGIARDITEKKKADDALKASEKRFKALFEYAPDAYFLHDIKSYRYVDCNLAAQKLTGYSKEELIGKNYLDLNLMPLDQAEKITKFIGQVKSDLKKEHIWPDEIKLIRKNGAQIYIEARTIAIEIEEQPFILGITRDISERRNLEQQLLHSQKLEAVGRLSGGIAHDFNNLLTMVLGNAELILEDSIIDDKGMERIQEIHAAGERAASLTRQLLAFSRKQVLQPKIMNLNKTAKTMEKMLLRMIGENIELRTFLAPDLGQIEADTGQIEQVIMNLIVNARDAMPDGGKITLETENVDIDEKYADAHISVIPGPYVMLSISDTGMGMSDETRSHIFDPFYTTKEKGKGTGLGLSTVYGIIKQSKGNIWVYSEPGKGCTFKIYLPRIEKPIPKTKLKPDIINTLTGSETILLAEDDEMVRKFTVKALQKYGYHVLTAANGEEAIEISLTYKDTIHLLLTDVVMPGINSRDMEESIKALRPKIKVLYMSGYTDNTIVHYGVLEPGKEFIAKPFTPDSIARKIREVIDK